MKHRNEQDQPLKGMRILVADDEFMILAWIEEALGDAGAEVVTASTLPDALKGAADESLSAALLDVRLGRQTTETVADVLAARAVPFVFHSGQALPGAIRKKYPEVELILKPSSHTNFIETILRSARH